MVERDMKILIGVDRLSYGSGISRVTYDIAEALYNKNYNVKLITGECNIQSDVPTIICKYNKNLYQSNFADVIRLLKKEKPDIFHSHYYPMDLCGTLIKFTGTKHIVHSHGVNHGNWHIGWKNLLSSLRADFGEFVSTKYCDKIIPVSNYMATELQSKWDIENTKIEVLYNSINLAKFGNNTECHTIRDTFDIDDEQIILLCVGALMPIKRHDLLIKCMRLVTKDVDNIKLLVVGGGGRTMARHINELKNLITKYNLDGTITLCGNVAWKDLPMYYACSNIFVSASISETFGLPFAEASASAKPIIGFDTTAISELIIDKYNGLKVKPYDINEMSEKIIHLANNEDLTKYMGNNGRRLAEENFNIDINIQKLIKIYTSCLND